MIGAIDIGGSKIAVGAVRPEGIVTARRSTPTRGVDGPEAAVREITAMLRECAAVYTGIGIGCTGPVDPLNGVLGNVDLLPGWRGFPLVERLVREFAVDVAMENDADAAALAESAWGAGRDAARFLYITVGTGIGTALVIDGRLYRGSDGSHPEAGHHGIDRDGPLCYCGLRGCWESLASGPAMASRWVEGGGARQICALARSGNALALEAVRQEAHYLGVGLANLIAILCPDRVALGGGVMESADLLLPTVRTTVASRCGLVPFDPARIDRAALGDDAPLLGAARVWQCRIAETSKARSCV